jgi:hypothetical protein
MVTIRVVGLSCNPILAFILDHGTMRIFSAISLSLHNMLLVPGIKSKATVIAACVVLFAGAILERSWIEAVQYKPRLLLLIKCLP